MELKISHDSGTHTRRYELLLDGHIIYMILTEEFLSQVGEKEAGLFVLDKFTAEIQKLLHKTFVAPKEVDAPSYSHELGLSPAHYHKSVKPSHKYAIGDNSIIDYVAGDWHSGGVVNTSLKSLHAGESLKGSAGSGALVKSLTKLFPALKQQVCCPDPEVCFNYYDPEGCYEPGSEPKYPLSSLVQHLNDIHKWTREKIADWLEELDLDIKATQGV